MDWQIFSQQNYRKLSCEYCLPAPMQPAIMAFALHNRAGQVYALTQAPPPTHTQFAVAILDWQALRDSAVWRQIWQVYPLASIDIAYYWQQTLKKQAAPDAIPVSVLLESCGLQAHFQSIAQWEALGQLGKSSRQLARQYGFGIRVLRLWERLSHVEQAYWWQLWQEYIQAFGQNLIQEIICYYYELPAKQREQARLRCQQLSHAWQKKMAQKYNQSVQKSKEHKKFREKFPEKFPATQIRDVIRELHSPHIYAIQKKVARQRQKLTRQTGKHIQVKLAPHLENTHLHLELSFTNIAELDQRLQTLTSDATQKTLQELLDLLG